MPPSVNPSNEYTSSFRPSALPEEKKSGIIFHHNAKPSEALSNIYLIEGLEEHQISLTSQDHITTTYSFPPQPDYDLNAYKLSLTNTGKENTSNKEYGLPILHKREDHNSTSVKSVTESKAVSYNSEDANSETSAEGSGSGDTFSQDWDGTATVKPDVSTFIRSTISFNWNSTGEKRKPTGTETASETGYVKDATEEEEDEEEGELSGEEDDKMKQRGILGGENETGRAVVDGADQSGRQFTANHNMLKIKEKHTEGETFRGNTIYSESGSGTEIGSPTFSWSEDVSGSGEGGEDKDTGKISEGKESEDARDEVNEEDKNNTEDETNNSSVGKQNGDLVEHVKERTNEDGGAGGPVVVPGEASQRFSDMDELLIDAARSTVLGRLVPLLRLTDANKDTEDKVEGKYSASWCSFLYPLMIEVK